MSLFDVYTVSTLSSPFGPLTVMSAPPLHYRGARPKTANRQCQLRVCCVSLQGLQNRPQSTSLYGQDT